MCLQAKISAPGWHCPACADGAAGPLLLPPHLGHTDLSLSEVPAVSSQALRLLQVAWALALICPMLVLINDATSNSGLGVPTYTFSIAGMPQAPLQLHSVPKTGFV